MKQILFLSLTVFYISYARAELNLEMGITLPNSTNLYVGVVDKIKGNQCREDEVVAYYNNESHILNLNSGERFTLTPGKKMAVKTYLDQSMRTNAIPIDAIEDTGKSQVVDGHDAEIYSYTNSIGSYTLWIAKDFPDFATIKKDLAKRDRLHLATGSAGLHMSTLPGMLLKRSIDNLHTNILLHVVVIKEPIDDSVFEVPKDYYLSGTNAPVANTNEVISITNEPPTK